MASFLKAVVAEKKSLAEGLLEAGIDPNEVIPQPGEEGYQDYVRTQIELENQRKQADQFRQQRHQKLQQSAKVFDEFLGQVRMDPKEEKAFSKKVNDVLLAINDGDVNETVYQMIYDAMFLPKKLKSETRKVELRARNEEIRKKRVTIKKPGDGIKRPAKKSTSDLDGGGNMEFANDGSEAFVKMFGSDF